MTDLTINIDSLNQSTWTTFTGLTIEEGYNKWVEIHKTLNKEEHAYWKKFFRKHIYGMD